MTKLAMPTGWTSGGRRPIASTTCQIGSRPPPAWRRMGEIDDIRRTQQCNCKPDRITGVMKCNLERHTRRVKTRNVNVMWLIMPIFLTDKRYATAVMGLTLCHVPWRHLPPQSP